MSITLKTVQDKKDLKRFVYLPEKLNAHRPEWVPPIYSDDMRVLDPKRNPARLKLKRKSIKVLNK